MIVSFVEGRMRIRDERLKMPTIANAVEKTLMRIRGITEAAVNRRAGSILVLYARGVLKMQQILNILADYLDINTFYRKTEQVVRKPVIRRRIASIGMLFSLALSLVAALADLMPLHVILGIVFLGFLGLHLYRSKNIIFV